MQDVKGKVAVVTGAASGIGLAMSKRFAAEGMKVVLADIEAAALERARLEMPNGAETLCVVTDVSSAEQMDALAARTLEHFGAVHVVCNNAGVSLGSRTWKTSIHDWQWLLGVNLWGVIHGIRVFAPLLIAQNEGHIVNTASVAGLFSVPGSGAYNVSKQAVVALSETLTFELELQKSAVCVSVLCPGFVKTHIHEAERNRPQSLRDPSSVRSETQHRGAQERKDQLAAWVAAGQEPDVIAEHVLSAIREQRFYILTHPEILPLFEERARRLLEGKNPRAPKPPR